MMQSDIHNETNHQTTVVFAVCPSCGAHCQFTYQGEQRWPAGIAERKGLPNRIRLWNCENCHTTVSEHSLMCAD